MTLPREMLENLAKDREESHRWWMIRTITGIAFTLILLSAMVWWTVYEVRRFDSLKRACRMQSCAVGVPEVHDDECVCIVYRITREP